MNARIFVLWFALLLAAPLFARDKSDVISMKNGDRVTCEIKGLNANTLFISVDYILNTLSVDWSKVDHRREQANVHRQDSRWPGLLRRALHSRHFRGTPRQDPNSGASDTKVDLEEN